MTNGTLAGMAIILVIFLVATLAFRAWRNHVIREEYERFSEEGGKAQEGGSADSLDTSS